MSDVFEGEGVDENVENVGIIENVENQTIEKTEEESDNMMEEGSNMVTEDDEPPPPPLQGEEKELLFLIEFLVDTLHIKPKMFEELRMDPCNLQGENSIVLTFLHFPPMSICETDLDTEKNVGGENTVFNAGKSLVFALTESQFEDPPPVFLEVAAYKTMPHGFDIPKIEVGRTKIDLSKLFCMVFDKYDEKPNELPVSKSIKDNYILKMSGEEWGDVDIYIRLTCLGQNIVTEFQSPGGVCDPFLFKNLESEKMYECRQTREKEDLVPVPKQTGTSCRYDEQSEVEPEVEPDPEDENYEQIYAEINGSTLIVSVEKNKRKEAPKPFKLEDFCDCEIPLPPDLVQGLSELSITPLTGGKQEIPDGGVGKCNNRIFFQVPPSDKLAQAGGYNAVTYSVNTCNEGEKHGHKGKNSFKIIRDNDVYRPTMPNDSVKDTFVLRIIKRGKSGKGKGALELEFRTPKEKITPPPKPPYMIERGIGPEKQDKGKKKKKK